MRQTGGSEKNGVAKGLRRDNPLHERFEDSVYDSHDDTGDYYTREELACEDMGRCWRAAERIRKSMEGEVKGLTKEVENLAPITGRQADVERLLEEANR